MGNQKQHRPAQALPVQATQSDALPKGQEVSLFPTTVWIFPPEPSTLDVTTLGQVSLKLQQEMEHQAIEQRSARHCWRMNSPHLKPVFAKAYEHIQAALSVINSKLELPPGQHQFDSWLNVVKPGGFHVIHNHAPNLLSGVLYLTDCIESTRLMLRDPRPARLCFPSTQTGPCEIPVKSSAGSMVIFPGWLEHWVEQNASDTHVIYIAFNLGDKTNQLQS